MARKAGHRCQVLPWGADAEHGWLWGYIQSYEPVPDLAVVSVPALDHPVTPIRWGRLSDGSEPIRWEAIGFPVAGLGDSGRQPESAWGDVSPATEVFSERMGLVIQSRDTQVTANGTSGWAGLSGAAVFCSDRLVGVVIEDPQGFTGSLTARRVSCVTRYPLLYAALGSPEFDQVSASPEFLFSYLRAARAGARQHPYMISLPGMPQLTTVYVTQKLRNQVPRARPQRITLTDDIDTIAGRYNPAAEDERAAQDEASDLLRSLDPWEILRRHSAILIIGGAGTGKSSFLRHVVEALADSWLQGDTESFVPVYIRAEALSVSSSFPEALAAGVTRELSTFLDHSNLEALLARQPMPETPWLVLVDGIDEILDFTIRAKILDTVAHWLNDPRYRFVLTSRLLPEKEFERILRLDVQLFEMQPFTEHESLLLAERWLTELGCSEASDIVNGFIASLFQSRLGRLARNPLIVTVVCIAFAEDPSLKVPLSRADLYERFVKSLLEKPFIQFNALERLVERVRPYGDEPKRAVGKVVNDLLPLSEYLADGRMLKDRKRLLLESAQAYPSCSRPSEVDSPIWRDILSEVLRQNGCLLQHGADFVFIHQTVMEYLAARSIGRSPSLRRRQKEELKNKASHGDSYALFAVSILRTAGIDLTQPVPRFSHVRKVVHARLVAAMADEGISFEPKTIDLVTRRLTKMTATQPQQSFRSEFKKLILLGEDERVAAAKSLAELNSGDGHLVLGQMATAADVSGFDIFDFIAQDSIRSPANDADRQRGIRALVDLASKPVQDGFYRVMVAKLALELDADAGTQTLEKISRDSSLDSVYRLECVSQLLKSDRERGVEALAAFIADPSAEISLRFDAARRLTRISPSRSFDALEQIALNRENTGLARHIASRTIYIELPSVGKQVIFEFAFDKSLSVFHRIGASGLLNDADATENLARLAADPGLAGKLRLSAAKDLAIYSPEKGVVAMRDIANASNVGLWMRVWAALNAWSYRRIYRARIGRKELQ